jgi:hypothetical protein
MTDLERYRALPERPFAAGSDEEQRVIALWSRALAPELARYAHAGAEGVHEGDALAKMGDGPMWLSSCGLVALERFYDRVPPFMQHVVKRALGDVAFPWVKSTDWFRGTKWPLPRGPSRKGAVRHLAEDALRERYPGVSLEVAAAFHYLRWALEGDLEHDARAFEAALACSEDEVVRAVALLFEAAGGRSSPEAEAVGRAIAPRVRAEAAGSTEDPLGPRPFGEAELEASEFGRRAWTAFAERERVTIAGPLLFWSLLPDHQRWYLDAGARLSPEGRAKILREVFRADFLGDAPFTTLAAFDRLEWITHAAARRKADLDALGEELESAAATSPGARAAACHWFGRGTPDPDSERALMAPLFEERFRIDLTPAPTEHEIARMLESVCDWQKPHARAALEKLQTSYPPRVRLAFRKALVEKGPRAI